MREALSEAEAASGRGEVPIGALIVADGEVIARAHNLKENGPDPTGHAEILVLREAAKKLARWRLTGATLYVTMEPCAMCAGAAVQARLSRLVFGVKDPKGGGCGSVFNIVQHPRLNHQIEVVSGVLEEEIGALLQRFFEGLRNRGAEGGLPPSFIGEMAESG